jgi:transcriptional regulator with XRE-family HTH domain
MSALGSTLANVRRRRGVSQRALAIRAGTSQAAISRIESGKELPSFERFEQLLLVLGERPVLTTEPSLPADEVARLLDLTLAPADRLQEAASWNLLMSRLEASA